MSDANIKPTKSEISKTTQSAQAPLTVLFLDSALTFANSQNELLQLALFLREQGFVPHICCPKSSKLMQKAKEHELLTIAFSDAGKPNLFVLMRLFFMQKRTQPLCIHSFAENCLPLAKRLAKLRLENSTLVLHSCFDTPAVSKGKSLPNHWATPKKIIYPHKVMANMWIEQGIDPAKSVIIHTAHQNLVPCYKQPNKRRVFAVMESLEEDSGIDILLKSMAAIWQHPHLPEWEVRVIGSGSRFENLLTEAHGLGVSTRLAMLGDQPLENILSQADVVISPFTGPQGNLSSLMAAWCTGLPLICTTVNAHMEVAHTGNALTIADMDPQRLAAAIIELMCNPERVENLRTIGASMHEYARMPRLIEQYFKLYNDCIAHHGWVLPIKHREDKKRVNNEV